MKNDLMQMKGSFMATSIIGLIVSVKFVYNWWADMGVAFTVVFAAMFLASLVSMTKETNSVPKIRTVKASQEVIKKNPAKKVIKKPAAKKKVVKKKTAKKASKKKATKKKVTKKKSTKKR